MTTRIPLVPAVVTGLLAVAAALGLSHLVAGLVDPPSSPFLAVGNAAIDRTPKPVRDFGIETFGSNDKPVLLLGVGIAMVILGVVAGVISRRSAVPGIVLVAALGVVGLLAVRSRPDTTTVGLVCPVVAAVAGVAVLVVLRRLALRRRQPPTTGPEGDEPVELPDHPGSTALPAGDPVSRRGFLGATAGVAAIAGAAAYGGQRAGRVDVGGSQTAVGELTPTQALAPLPSSAQFVSENGLPFITDNQAFYRVDTALGNGPALVADDWSLRIHGMVDKELTVSFAELLTRPIVAHRLTFTCISYVIGSQLVSTADFTGVSLRDLLMEAKPQDGADMIFSTSSDGYTASTPLDAALAQGSEAMLAVNMNGRPLPQEHGFPVRMIVPGFYGYCSATKWLVDIEVTTFAQRTAYWTSRGYAKFAPVKIGSKIAFPKGLSAAVPPGTVTATGAAWAQPHGISKVETKLDDGAWTPTRLGSDEGPSAWRMWRVDLPKVTAGNHLLTVRAYDGDGRMQTEEKSEVLPDGQSGYHRINFSVG